MYIVVQTETYSRRTCYRTCITDDELDCNACLTVVNNQRMRILAPRGNRQQDLYNVRILHSPNFLDDRGLLYRESTICMYGTWI